MKLAIAIIAAIIVPGGLCVLAIAAAARWLASRQRRVAVAGAFAPALGAA